MCIEYEEDERTKQEVSECPQDGDIILFKNWEKLKIKNKLVPFILYYKGQWYLPEGNKFLYAFFYLQNLPDILEVVDFTDTLAHKQGFSISDIVNKKYVQQYSKDRRLCKP